MSDSFPLISVGDVHAADRPPLSRRDDYRTTVLKKVERVGTIAAKAKVKAVVFTGDIFHKKEPHRNSHGLVRDLINVLQAFPCPCYAAPGNHDMSNDRLDSIPRQPLGVVFQSGALIELTPEGVLQTVGDLKVRIAATSYNEIEPFPECQRVKKNGADVLVTVGHFYATPQGGPFFNHVAVSYNQLADTETDIWVLGHFHMDQGIKEVRERTFINLGSLTRGALDEDTLTRQVKIGHVSITKGAGKVSWKAQAVLLPVAPVEEVFDLEKHHTKVAERQAVEAFVQQLESEFAQAEGDVSDPQAFLRTMSIPDRVRQETLKRIEAAASP